MTSTNNPLALIAILILLGTITGCGDDRVVQISREAADRQAAQNREMARIVADEAAVRQQAMKLQNDLRADQAAVAKARDRLEVERQEIANRREWAMFLTPALETIAIIAVVVYCSFVVACGFRNDSRADPQVVGLLVQQAGRGRLPRLPAPGKVLRLPAPAGAEAAKAAGN